MKRNGPLLGAVVTMLLIMSVTVSSGFPLLALETLAREGYVEVSLDTSRFRQDGVATMRILNKVDIPIEGEIDTCLTVFEPKDARFSPLRPQEGGSFIVQPKKTVLVTRLFRSIDASKSAPNGTAYVLSLKPERITAPDCKD